MSKVESQIAIDAPGKTESTEKNQVEMERTMNKVEDQIVIDAPVQQVWEVLADFGGVYRWAPSVTNSYSTSDSNGGREASRHCDVAGFGGIEETITEWNEGREFTYVFTGVGPISEGYSTWSVKPQGDKTLVHTELRYTVRFGPLGVLMNALIMRRKLNQSLKTSLEGLKHHVKTGDPIGVHFRAPVAA